MFRISLTDIRLAGMMGQKSQQEASSSLLNSGNVAKIKQSLITARYLAYHQMTQVKDYKIDIFPCHPSRLFILLMEGLSVHISMLIHFVKVYGILSNLRFIRSLFSSATRKQQWLSYSLSEQQRWPYVRERERALAMQANIKDMRFHLFKRSRDSV